MKILITGASSGIGFLTGCVLVSRGHEVFMTTRTEEEAKNLEEKTDKLSLAVKIFKMDVTSKMDCEKISNLDLDVLFLHAGVGYTGLLENIDIDLLRNNFEVNVFSNLELIQKFMKSSSKSKKVVMTSSLLASHSCPFFGSYVMTKTTIEMMMKILRRENIFNDNCFITIRPGAYHTGFNQYMILSGEKSLLSDKTQNILNTIFAMIEERDIRSIVYKTVLAIERGNKKVYSAPLWQSVLSKLTF